MTVLAAYQGNGFAIIGADSRATDESGSYFRLANKKITWDKSGDWLFAISGASRGGNLIQQGWTPPDAPAFSDVDQLDVFMTQTFIPMLRDHFVDSGYDAKDDGEAAWQDSSFLIAVHGIIYPIFNDYSWDRELRGIYVGGSGGDIALGVMAEADIQKYKDDPKGAAAIIKRACEKACEWNAYCAPPVIIETQHAR